MKKIILILQVTINCDLKQNYLLREKLQPLVNKVYCQILKEKLQPPVNNVYCLIAFHNAVNGYRELDI